jgi:hypothetical protein
MVMSRDCNLIQLGPKPKLFGYLETNINKVLNVLLS